MLQLKKEPEWVIEMGKAHWIARNPQTGGRYHTIMRGNAEAFASLADAETVAFGIVTTEPLWVGLIRVVRR